jgi:Flp pilus assembly protein TadG
MDERVLTPMTLAASKPAGEPSRPSTRKRSFLGRLRSEERGTAMVEFALVALPLFLMIGGIIDFARAMNYYNDLTQLAGQGARAAAVSRNPDGTTINGGGTLDPTHCDGRADSIQCLLVSYYTTTVELKNGISVCLGKMDAAGTITNTAPVGGSPVTVRATYSFNFLPLVRSAAIRLSATQSLRSEVQSPIYAGGAVHWNGTSVVSGGDACTR